MHPKMPIQIYFIKFWGQPILEFYGTAMILDNIMNFLAPRCDISKSTNNQQMASVFPKARPLFFLITGS
jgi:hypothetical protein